MKNIYLIVGESGTGKTAIVNELEKKAALKQIMSYTTRPKRYDNEIGHSWVSIDDFNKLYLVAKKELYGNFYGVTENQIKENDLYIIDPETAVEIKDIIPDKGAKIIYITCCYNTRFDRMRQRGDTIEQSLKRIVDDVIPFKDFKKKADYIVKNEEDSNINNIVKDVMDFIVLSEKD